MTYIYEWFSFPDTFSVICPNCEKESNCSEICISKTYNGRKQFYKSGKNSEKKGEFLVKINCIHCGYTNEKQVSWPKDAYWTFDIKGEILWAWSKEHSEVILEYIVSKDREQLGRHGSSLFHIPKHFKLAKNRDTVVRKIEKRLKSI